MVISFANQKGGVGKSTLCLSLANYFASIGLPVTVIDTDTQKTLVKIRETDMEQHPQEQPPFEIEYAEISKFMEDVKTRRQEGTNLFVDLPGRYDRGVHEVIKYSDVVIVPFQYEETVLFTTAMFATYLDIINDRYTNLKRMCIFVPNAVNFSIGRREDKVKWDAWKKAIASKASLSPLIPDRVCMQRRSSLALSNEERECVNSCFEYIHSIIFDEPQTPEKKI